MPRDINQPHPKVNGKSLTSKETLFQCAIEGHVLVKNKNNALPFKFNSPYLTSVFRYDAVGPDQFDVTIDETPSTSAIQNTTLYVGGGSGANSAAYLDSPFDALRRLACEDGSSIMWNFNSQDPDIDPTSDVCLVFVNSYAAEETDYPGLMDEYSDTLITNVAAKCNDTIVIIHNAAIRVVDPSIETDNVTAVIFAYLPGQDTDRALVDILYGGANPSGKLQYTVAMSPSEYGSILEPSLPQGQYWLFLQSDFTEGLFDGDPIGISLEGIPGRDSPGG
jgi:beta-glucosidase